MLSVPNRTPMRPSARRLGPSRSRSAAAASAADTQPSASTSWNTRPGPVERQGLRREQRRQAALYLALDELLQPLAHPLARLSIEEIAGLHLDPRRQDRLAGDDAADRPAAPAQPTGSVDCEGIVAI